MDRCTIIVLRKEKVVARYPVVTQKGASVAQLEIGKSVKTLKSTDRKPALRAAMECVMLAFKGYDPQTDRVTLEQPEEMGPEGF